MAVALQDHLAKQYSLSFSDPFLKKTSHQIGTPPRASSLQPSPASSCTGCGKGAHQNRHKPKKQTVLSFNSDVLALNANSDGRETVRPNGAQAGSNSNVKKSKITPKQEIEHVLDKAPPPLSLAQRMGLVEAPPSLLSNAEWKKVKTISVHRHDSASPCPICHESFGLTKQVNIIESLLASEYNISKHLILVRCLYVVK